MPYKYIGRTTDFAGKTLWELVGNLKNFGVGRLITRSRFNKYPEASYMKIVKVEALPNPKNPSLDDVRKVRVFVERTFRGVKEPKLVNIESASYKADYKLIPKHEEERFLKAEAKPKEQLMPQYMDFPPLMREFLLRENPNLKPEELRCEMVYKKDVQVARDGQKPTVDLSNTLNTKYAPELYKNITA